MHRAHIVHRPALFVSGWHRRPLVIAALCLALLCVCPLPTAADDSQPNASGYVGSATCASCHPQAYADWRPSNHARAMQTADASTVLGKFNGDVVDPSGTTARFFTRDGKFFVRTDGADGKPADFEIAYTFGVEPLQQYLIAQPGGRLQSYTTAWDSRLEANGGQRWFSLYPGEHLAAGDPLHWTGADQNWNFTCASCHSTDLRKNYDLGANRYATTWSEIDVACEACHGPGARHVAWGRAAAGSTPSVTPGSASSPADNGLAVHLGGAAAVTWSIDPVSGNARPSTVPRPDTVIDACAPCHARRTTISHTYQPGQPLLDADVPALLTPGLYHADGQIDGEVYEYGSFLQSKMYRQGVTCTNCHAPHSLRLRAAGNAVCTQCHLASKYDSAAHHFHRPDSAGAQCVACHMPSKTYMIVDPRHDHSLRVPRPDLSVELGTPNPCTQCHAERSAAWARDQVRSWYGHDPQGYQTYARALHAGRAGALDAAPLLSRLVEDTGQPGIARATGLGLLQRTPGAAFLAALDGGLRDRDGLVRRAAAAALGALPPQARIARAAPLLDDPLRAVRIEAGRQLAAVPRDGLDPALRAKLDRALAEYITAQRVDADRPESHTNLAMLYAEQGDVVHAEQELQTALALRADFVPAYVNLADVYRAQQREADAERVLRAGLAVAPNDAALHHALGLLLVRQRRLGDALVELRQAAERQPTEPRYAYVLGVAQHASGQVDEALQTLRAAHERHPSDRDLLLALATISRDAGRRDAAREWARQLAALAPDDAQARQLLEQLSAAP
jgi:Flp pilus assembly protein TadD